MARIKKKSYGRKGGITTIKSRRKTVSKYRKGKLSGYTLKLKPRKGKNKLVKVTKIKVRR